MKSGLTPKSIVLFFPLVVLLYFVFFYGIERARQRKGAWLVDFGTNSDGSPTLTVSQTSLGLTNMTLVFHGDDPTNTPGRVVFDRVRRPVPFGRVLYEDLTFLPGVVTMDVYGHEIELLPRVLFVNRREIQWRSKATVDLWPTNKPAVPPQPPRSKSRGMSSRTSAFINAPCFLST